MQFSPTPFNELADRMEKDGVIVTAGQAAVNGYALNHCTRGFVDVIYSTGFAAGVAHQKRLELERKAAMFDQICANIKPPAFKPRWWRSLFKRHHELPR